MCCMSHNYQRLYDLILESDREGLHPFIGYGNPDARILIVGKECALEEGSTNWKKFYQKNFYQWWKSFKERGFSYKPGEEYKGKDYNFDDGYFHPIFPYYPQRNTTKISPTYYYYQRLYECIFDLKKSEYFSFFERCFITELNERCRPNNYDLKKDERKIIDEETEEAIRNRFDWMRRTNFFNHFEIVILACGPYANAIKSDSLLRKDLFGDARVYYCNQLSQWWKKALEDDIIPNIKIIENMSYTGYLRLPKAKSKSVMTLKGDNIVVTREIEIKDYATYLKYDWHLYNLPHDIDGLSSDNPKKLYLQKAKEIFSKEYDESTPNKRLDLFGTHSVFFYLYGHTADWVSWAEHNCQCIKDFFTCVQGDNKVKTIKIIRQSMDVSEAESQLCEVFGIAIQSAKQLLSLPLSALAGLVPQQIVEEDLPEAEMFLTKVTELEKFDKMN